MQRTLISLSLILLLNSPARAQNDVLPSAPPPDLVYLGKGLQARDHGSWVALQCESSKPVVTQVGDCESFRHLYYDETAGTYRDIGPLIINDADIQLRLKSLGKGFQHFLNETTNRRLVRTLVIAGIAAGALFVPIFLAAGEAPVLAAGAAGKIQAWIGMPLLFGAVPMIGNNADLGGFREGTLNHALQNREGWNWASEPRKLRDKMFSRYVQFLDGCSIQGTCFHPIRAKGKRVRLDGSTSAAPSVRP